MDELSVQKKEFYDRLEKHIQTNINKLKRDKYVVTREMQDTALSLLKVKKGLKCNEGARLKFWVHEKFYPGPTGKELYCKKTHKPVVAKEDLFDVIHGYHCRIGHRKKEGTWKEVCARHSWVKRDIIDIYITTCRTCCGDVNSPCRQKHSTDIEVAAQGFMTRLTISMINMEDMPDRDYKYILLVRDCATKFTTAWPLKNIEDEVVGCLLQFFGQFGPPKFIHALDSQFPNMAQTIYELKVYWPMLSVLHGRSNHPAFIGVGERACADLQSKLGAWMAKYENDNIGWANGLGVCTFQMNSALSSESVRSPFQSVFGMFPREPDLLWKTVTARGWTKEEEVPDFVMKMFEIKEEESKSAKSPQEHTPASAVHQSAPSTSQSGEGMETETHVYKPLPGPSSKPLPISPPDDLDTEIDVTPDDEIEVKIERVDDDESEPVQIQKFTYKY